MSYQIIHGDCKSLMHMADGMKACITDPIWPNSKKIFGDIDHVGIARETFDNLPSSVERLVVVLGCDSDPRWLYQVIPKRFPYLKNCFLEFCPPVPKGRNLYTHLSAYCFGTWPPSKDGARVIPSKVMSVDSEKKISWHPCPMRVQHCQWLIKWFGDGGVVDPFCGSGSFGVASKRLRTPYIGFEINKEWAEKAKARLDQEIEPWC